MLVELIHNDVISLGLGVLYVLGGKAAGSRVASAKVYAFEIKTNTWSCVFTPETAEALSCARQYPQAAVVNDRMCGFRIQFDNTLILLLLCLIFSFVFGGLDGNDRPVSSNRVLSFNLSTRQWLEVTTPAEGPFVVCGGAMVAHKNSLFLFGQSPLLLGIIELKWSGV